MLKADTKDFLWGFVPFILGILICVGIIVSLWPKQVEKTVDSPQVDSKPPSVNLGAGDVLTPTPKPISVELKGKIDEFKVELARKDNTEFEVSAIKLIAIDLYNAVSKETGRPPVIHLTDGVSFEDALFAAVQSAN